MKSTGVVRNVDVLGRIVIPKEIRTAFNIKTGDPVEIFTDDGNMVLFRKYEPFCIFCGDSNGIVDFYDRKICRKCIEKIGLYPG